MTFPVTTTRAIDWWSVHEHVDPLLAEVGSWPMAGTLTWQRLADDDPRKLAALLDAARHWALRLDSEQEERANAGAEVAQGTDWAAVARSVRRRDSDAYIPRRAS